MSFKRLVGLMNARAQHRFGLAMLVAGAVAFSLGGYFARLIPTGAATMLFWRGIFAGLFITLWVIAANRTLRPFRVIGRAEVLITLCSAGAMIGFLTALQFTSVANVAVIFATCPLLTAGLAWVWLGERPRAITLGAALLALAGVAVMTAGAAGADDRLGDGLALLMTLSNAVLTVLLRRHRAVSMLPAAALSAYLVSLVTLPFAAPLAVSGSEFAHLVLFGTAQSGLGVVLLVIGSRYVPAAQNAVIASLEAPLAPLWVWLAFGETPAVTTLVGGAIVITAIIVNLCVVAISEPGLQSSAI